MKHAEYLTMRNPYCRSLVPSADAADCMLKIKKLFRDAVRWRVHKQKMSSIMLFRFVDLDVSFVNSKLFLLLKWLK